MTVSPPHPSEHVKGFSICTVSAGMMERCRTHTFPKAAPKQLRGQMVQHTPSTTSTCLHIRKTLCYCGKIFPHQIFHLLFGFLYQIEIHDSCFEVAVGQDVHVTLKTKPEYCHLTVSKSHSVPGKGNQIHLCEWHNIILSTPFVDIQVDI